MESISKTAKFLWYNTFDPIVIFMQRKYAFDTIFLHIAGLN